MLKISNSLILIPIFLFFLNLTNKFKISLICLLLCTPIYLWLYQNFLHTGCLIWPIEETCISISNNYSDKYTALNEKMIIEYYAKSVLVNQLNIEQIIDIENTKNFFYIKFFWINNWLANHLPRIIEKYGYFTILSILTLFLVNIFYKSHNFKFIERNKLNKTFKIILENLNFYISSIVIFIFWFFNFPVDRFASIYLLNFLLIFLIPVWIFFSFENYKVLKISSNILVIIALTFFLSDNLLKINKFIERKNIIWPINNF